MFVGLYVMWFVILLTYFDQVFLLKSIPLRLYVNVLTFTGISFSTGLDWANVSFPLR